jgi:hypothetical protein
MRYCCNVDLCRWALKQAISPTEFPRLVATQKTNQSCSRHYLLPLFHQYCQHHLSNKSLYSSAKSRVRLIKLQARLMMIMLGRKQAKPVSFLLLPSGTVSFLSSTSVLISPSVKWAVVKLASARSACFASLQANVHQLFAKPFLKLFFALRRSAMFRRAHPHVIFVAASNK